jgi:hypothetical protein
MKRLLALVLVTGALALPGAAAAGGGAETEVKVTDAAGTIQLSSSDDAVAARRVGSSSRAGCRTVDVAHVGRDIFRLVVYKFHQRKRWCWNYPRITWKRVTTYVSDVDPNMEYRGVVAANGYFYTWCCGNRRSGHVSLRQAKFENCVLWFPCTRTEYPWVRIRVRGDGSWRAATGL